MAFIRRLNEVLSSQSLNPEEIFESACSSICGILKTSESPL
jgi:hypothetical protein